MKQYHYWIYSFPIGEMEIAEDGSGISYLSFVRNQRETGCEKKETPLIREAGKQLHAYFTGQRKVFELPLSFAGTVFQEKVWRALLEIPYGETRSYQDIAKTVGNANACRAVGMANNRNSIIIVVPCHRVIGKDGKLVGYGEGLGVKQYLLELEKKFT